MTMFDAVLFDMDGLLLDSERVHLRAWTAAAATEGITIRDEVYSTVIGRAAQDSHRLFVEMLGGPASYARVRAKVDADLHRGGRPVVFPLKPGVGELLVALRALRVPCAVASSTRADEIRRRLDAVGVLAQFDAVAGGDEVVRGKPDPAIYHLAAERLGVSASACVAFEDSENGARAALAAGTALIVVPDLRRPPPEVLARSLHVFDSLHEAHPHLPRWFPAGRDDSLPQDV
jgi:beta-phosphoglucomutase-like phosphatase (HAD superfamily)